MFLGTYRYSSPGAGGNCSSSFYTQLRRSSSRLRLGRNTRVVWLHRTLFSPFFSFLFFCFCFFFFSFYFTFFSFFFFFFFFSLLFEMSHPLNPQDEESSVKEGVDEEELSTRDIDVIKNLDR